MWLKKITEVIPARASDVIIGTDAVTPLADAAGLAPVSRDLIWDKEIDRSNPITQIRVYVKLNVDVVATAANPDGWGAILKNVLFQRQGVGAAPGSETKRGKLDVVNAAGIDVLQRRWHVSKLDRNTVTALTNQTVRTNYVLCYVIDLADDQVVDPLRTITACPVHLDSANPILKLSFSSQADMEASGGTAFKVKHLVAEVHVIRADMPTEVTAKIVADGGFLEHDLVTREITFSANAKQRVEIESPGEYSSLMLTTFTSATARGSINDANDLIYDLQQQNRSVRAFTATGLQSENDDSIIDVTTQLFTHNSLLDFVGDQLGNAENNLGSLLDTNLEQQNGQKTILAFKGGGSGHKLRWTARRYLSPIGARRFRFA